MIRVKNENVEDDINGKYSIMISSSNLDFEDQLDELCGYLSSMGYNVVCSYEGTLKADPRFGNFENCYKAIEECDLFLGIVRPYTGSGNDNGYSVTFREFMHARECHKPSWYIVDKRVDWTREFCKSLSLRRNPKSKSNVLKWILKYYHIRTSLLEKKLPKVLDLFESNSNRRFNEECFEMEDFVNQRGKYKTADGLITNNWMQYCVNLQQMKTWIETNFKDYKMIEDNIKEA